MDIYMTELYKEIYYLSTDPAAKTHYSDIVIKSARGLAFETNKFAVYLMFPFVKDALRIADCIILPDDYNHCLFYWNDLLSEKEGSLKHVATLITNESEPETQCFEAIHDLDEVKTTLPNEPKESNTSNSINNICEFCCAQFTSYKAFRKHLKERHTQTFICSECGATFPNNSDLRKHQIRHKETGFKCEICGKKIKHSKNISRHLSLHA